MGRTNDAIIYGGVVQLMIQGSDSELEELSRKLLVTPPKIMGNHSKKFLKIMKWTFTKLMGHCLAQQL